MLKLSFSKPQYFHWTLGDGSHVTKCVYKCVRYGTGAFWEEEDYTDTFTAEGYAICTPEDDYDERLGNIISDSRAKSDAYSKARDMPEIIERIKKAMAKEQEILDFDNKMKFLKAQEAKHLEYVINRATYLAD